MKTPCETIVWSIVPLIKKEIAKNLVKESGLSQREVAFKLDTTEAAISRYISGKRGKSEALNKETTDEIMKSVNRLANGNGTSVIEEMCRICGYMKSSDFIDGINYACK